MVKKQAQLIITSKIVDLYNRHEAVRAEIGDRRNIKEGANDTSVSFLNGSKIVAVASNDAICCDEPRFSLSTRCDVHEGIGSFNHKD